MLNAALAVLILGTRPRRPANLLVGLLVAFNAATGIDQARALLNVFQDEPFLFFGPGEFLTWLSFFFTLPTLAALALLPLFFPRRLLSARAERFVLIGACAWVLANLIISAIEDELVTNSPTIGWSPYTVFLPFFLALLVGTIILLETYTGSPSAIQRDQARFLLAAYVFKATTYFVVLWGAFQNFDAQPAPIQVGLALYAIPVILAVAAVPVALASSRIRRQVATAERRPLSHDLFVLGIPALAIVMAYDVLLLPIEYMFIRPVLITYAILRYQLLDLDIRSRRATMAVTMLSSVAAVFVVVAYHAERYDLTPAIATGVAFTVTVGLAGILLWPLVRVLFEAVPSDPERRDRELYRAALESAVAAPPGHDSTDRSVLAALRARLRISDREHAAMEADARSLLGGPADELAVGQLFLGRYRVTRLLGEGGFGRTFLAEDEQMGRRVVLKAARAGSKEDARRTLREARLIAKLHHPNIVTIYDAEQVGTSVFLVLEYVEGGSLADALKTARRPVRGAEKIIADVLAALEAAHAEGIIHRDVKPANILLTRDGRAKVADFGVARAPAGSGTATGLSMGGEHPGSLHYMSPEQVRGGALDGRSDLYAVGVVWYELLAEKPYLDLGGRSEFEARVAILDERPRLPIHGAAPAVNELLKSILAKDPSRRPASATELRTRLATLGAAQPAR